MRRIPRAAALVIAVALAALGVPGAALAGPDVAPNWVQQSPATFPHASLTGAAMAYDARNGTVVMFGGESDAGLSNATWTWNGSTWTRQHPGQSPPARVYASMAYDPANGTVVLFGGDGGANGLLGDTWVWNGSRWGREFPKPSPSPRFQASMAFDAATGTMVLFGGSNKTDEPIGGTWTFNGGTWTKQAPATSPPARF